VHLWLEARFGWILPTLGDTKKAKDANTDFASLAQTMTERKAMLLAKGVPPAAEAAMVAGSHGKGDSPAQAADKSTTRAPKTRAAK
jgi:hypothetical protein